MGRAKYARPMQIDQPSRPMALVERDGFLAAEIEGDDLPTLTAAEVRKVLEALRR